MTGIVLIINRILILRSPPVPVKKCKINSGYFIGKVIDRYAKNIPPVLA